MTPVFAAAVFFVVWWIVLFAVLPFGLRTQGEAGAVVPGTPSSAPEKPRALRIIAITTLVASIVFAAIYAVLVFRLISLESLSIL